MDPMVSTYPCQGGATEPAPAEPYSVPRSAIGVQSIGNSLLYSAADTSNE